MSSFETVSSAQTAPNSTSSFISMITSTVQSAACARHDGPRKRKCLGALRWLSHVTCATGCKDQHQQILGIVESMDLTDEVGSTGFKDLSSLQTSRSPSRAFAKKSARVIDDFLANLKQDPDGPEGEEREQQEAAVPAAFVQVFEGGACSFFANDACADSFVDESEAQELYDAKAAKARARRAHRHKHDQQQGRTCSSSSSSLNPFPVLQRLLGSQLDRLAYLQTMAELLVGNEYDEEEEEEEEGNGSSSGSSGSSTKTSSCSLLGHLRSRHPTFSSFNEEDDDLVPCLLRFHCTMSSDGQKVVVGCTITPEPSWSAGQEGGASPQVTTDPYLYDLGRMVQVELARESNSEDYDDFVAGEDGDDGGEESEEGAAGARPRSFSLPFTPPRLLGIPPHMLHLQTEDDHDDDEKEGEEEGEENDDDKEANSKEATGARPRAFSLPHPLLIPPPPHMHQATQAQSPPPPPPQRIRQTPPKPSRRKSLPLSSSPSSSFPTSPASPFLRVPPLGPPLGTNLDQLLDHVPEHVPEAMVGSTNKTTSRSSSQQVRPLEHEVSFAVPAPSSSSSSSSSFTSKRPLYKQQQQPKGNSRSLLSALLLDDGGGGGRDDDGGGGGGSGIGDQGEQQHQQVSSSLTETTQPSLRLLSRASSSPSKTVKSPPPRRKSLASSFDALSFRPASKSCPPPPLAFMANNTAASGERERAPLPAPPSNSAPFPQPPTASSALFVSSRPASRSNPPPPHVTVFAHSHSCPLPPALPFSPKDDPPPVPPIRRNPLLTKKAASLSF